MLYHIEDTQHTQNTQINKLLVKMKKCVFYEKNHMDFLANPILCDMARKN